MYRLRVENRLIIIMEYVEGLPLERKCAKTQVSLYQAVDYICQSLAALHYAHNHGVVHRDFKPSNVLIANSGVVKLTDFGIASRAGDKRLTSTGVAIGSAYYMSPEQIKAAPLDGRADVYSVGITMYELATGHRPFEAENAFAIMKSHLDQPPPPASSRNPSVPDDLSHLIARALEKNPDDRYRHAQEFADALHLWSGTSAAMQATRTVVQPPAPAPEKTVTDPDRKSVCRERV